MTTQTRIRKPSRTAPADGAVETVTAPADAEQRAAHLADLDAMLDEIDEVLEENAEEFVKSYVQRGGE